LKDIWPSQEEVREIAAKVLTPAIFERVYKDVFTGPPEWQKISGVSGDQYAWRADSTYIQEPPFFVGLAKEPKKLEDIHGARVLALLGDSVTTDHISPAGDIAEKSPAGQFLKDKGVAKVDFNSYGARRGNDRVMVRGTFANIRLKNLMLGGEEGGNTVHLPKGEKLSIYDAAMKYKADGVPLVVLAGKEYGTGSSRDWAAKGTMLLGVRAVIAESFERIHRSNLVGMGVLPLVFSGGKNAEGLGLTGKEIFSIEGLSDLSPRKEVTVKAKKEDGSEVTFKTVARLDTPVDVLYFKNGGILQTVLRNLMG
jgi:aconitate hydratase